jgi:hypothetical protein
MMQMLLLLLLLSPVVEMDICRFVDMNNVDDVPAVVAGCTL